MLILFVVCFCQVLAGYENIYFGQSTWMAYTAMNRIYKYYDFNIKELASKKTSFSSYPGELLQICVSCHVKHNDCVMIWEACY